MSRKRENSNMMRRKKLEPDKQIMQQYYSEITIMKQKLIKMLKELSKVPENDLSTR
jgi:translation elongation factor EF-G